MLGASDLRSFRAVVGEQARDRVMDETITKALDYIADLDSIPAFDAAHYLEGSRALFALNLLLSLIKTGVAVCAAILALSDRAGVLHNVQFSDAAKWDMKLVDIAAKMDELLDEKKDGDGDKGGGGTPGREAAAWLRACALPC